MGLNTYNHPEVDRIWGIEFICSGSFKDHILSTPGWPPGWLYPHIVLRYVFFRNMEP